MNTTALTDAQQELYDEIVERANTEARGNYASVLAAYANDGTDPDDIEAVRFALYGAGRPASSDATMSVIFGVVGLTFCPLPFVGLAAIMSARRARRETRPGIKSGDGLATIGRVLGWLNIAIWVIIPAFGAAQVIMA